MRVVITGATGFVGSALSEFLVTNGVEVVRCGRKSGTQVDVVIPEIGSQTDWSSSLTGAEAVVHLAAKVHEFKSATNGDEFFEVNELGTIELARQAAQSGVKTFVFVSTIGVHGNASAAPFAIGDQPQPLGYYAESKLRAEQRLLAEFGSPNSPMRVVIIRPPMIYGKNAPGNFARLTKLLNTGLPIPLGAIENRRHFLYVGNLVDFIYNSLKNEKMRGIYLVADLEICTTSEFVSLMNKNLGGPSWVFKCPTGVLRAVGKLTGKSDMIEKLLVNIEINTEETLQVTGWQPPYRLQEGLRKSFGDSAQSGDH